MLERFEVEVQTADAAVLTRASAKANLLYNSSQIGLRDMQLTLDDSTLTGRVALEGERAAPTISPSTTSTSTAICRRRRNPTRRPRRARSTRSTCRSRSAHLDARGELKFGKAKFSGLTLTNVAFALTAANGAARLTPSAQLYGGRFSGDIRVQVKATPRRITVEQKLDDVDLAALGHDLLGSQDITGIGDVRLNLVTAGQNLGEMRRGLDGDVSFSVTNGSLEGIDLWFELRRARARLDGDDAAGARRRARGARRSRRCRRRASSRTRCSRTAT